MLRILSPFGGVSEIIWFDEARCSHTEMIQLPKFFRYLGSVRTFWNKPVVLCDRMCCRVSGQSLRKLLSGFEVRSDGFSEICKTDCGTEH